ncbi:tetratricopeptide repeat protein [Flavobacterium silvaticum]|uniref:Tetratricopeptide repeat protein n=1 Tax=Flavobacterium silvaticum TaxID=1852020 RepID=A0A972JJ36_9FLAO|nr:tetratricopeptide repeat protein [Flavobacterium silvaticum]NMH28948.1 tetratricopeptide repeat protein [Flavobacterium silvaticum]
MKAPFLLHFAIGFFSLSAIAQSGYWDRERATTKEFIVPAGDRVIVKTQNFPVGTTEVVYRITVLDDNQKMTNNLGAVLKAIPDPSGISQGTGASIQLLSTVSGKDECTYAIFTDKAKADAYKTSGKPDGACISQPNPISKEAKVIGGKSACLNKQFLYFAFESDNWFMRQKIVLEVVPWVDFKASTGWTNENKLAILNLCKSSNLAGLMIRPDDLCLCILDKFTQKYTFAEYSNLLVTEKSKLFRDFGAACLDSKSTSNKSVLETARQDAEKHFTNKNYEQAINLMQSAIIASGNGTATDYNMLAKYYLYSRQYQRAKAALDEAEKKDNADLLVKLNMAHYYLLTDDYRKAKEIHEKFMKQNISAKESWTDRTREDFIDFNKAGIASEDFYRILKLFPN